MSTITAKVFDKTNNKPASDLDVYIGYADGHVSYQTTGRKLTNIKTDKKGCISCSFPNVTVGEVLEIGFLTGDYWKAQSYNGNLIKKETVVRFDVVKQMQNPTYHVSLTIEPNGFVGTVT